MGKLVDWMSDRMFGPDDDWRPAIGHKALVLIGTWTPEGYVFVGDHPKEVSVEDMTGDNVKIDGEWWRSESLRLRCVINK